jgi:hypothetical protein
MRSANFFVHPVTWNPHHRETIGTEAVAGVPAHYPGALQERLYRR